MTGFRLSRLIGVPVPLLMLAALPGGAAAQAILVGRTITDSSKAPIAGVEIAVEKLGLKTQSGSDGKFSLPNIEWGVHTAVVRKIGYRPIRLRMMVASDDTLNLDIRLETAAVELPPLEVTTTSLPPGMEEFARRRLAGWGTYIDSKELRRQDHRRLSDLLTSIRGVRPVHYGFRTVLVSTRSGCPVAIWLDGMQIFSGGSRRSAPDIDEFSPYNLEAIEVYSGAAETPIELAGFSSCGAVALWSRRG